MVFGHDDLNHYVYRISDAGYLVVARGGEDVFEVYEDFDELLLSALSRVA